MQEPHVNGKNVITRLTQDTKIIASRNTDSRPRACIYYHKAMAKQLWIKDSLTTTDCGVAQTLVDGKNTILASCYMDRNDALCPPKAFRDIVDHAKTHNLALVVGSDVNAYNTVWNSSICDKVGSDRGDRLLEYLLENNLFIENVGSTPTFDNGRWKNVIDLTITNQLGHNLVEHWHVNEVGHDRNSSDHNYITFRSTGFTNLARPSFMDITKTDWDAYEAQLADNMTNLADSFSNLDFSDKVDKAADLLFQSIMEAFNSATDLTYVSCKVKPPPWDTPAVKEARRDMRTKLRLAIKSKDSGYNKAKRESRQNYEKIRNHTWSTKFKDFCDKLEAKSDSKRISSLIKYNKNTQLGTV